MTDGEAAAASTDSPAEDDAVGGLDTDRATRLLVWAGVVLLGLTAAVALAGFYNGVTGTIRVWVSDPYQPVFRAVFNLALLLAALGGIGLLVRRAD